MLKKEKNNKQVKNSILIKKYSIENHCTIREAQSKLGFGKYYFNDAIKFILSKPKGSICSDEDYDFLIKKADSSVNAKQCSKEGIDFIKVDGQIFTKEEIDKGDPKIMSVSVGANTTAIQMMQYHSLNEESIAKATGYDLTLYNVEVKGFKLYQSAMKMKDEHGVEKAHIVDLYSVQVKVTPKKPNYETISLPDWINEITPVKLDKSFERSVDGRMLYIPIFDLHFGKRNSDATVMSDWTSKVVDIINKSLIYNKSIGSINKVLLVFGGDTFNYDGIHGGTTKGTPQENIFGFKQMVYNFVKDFKSIVNFIAKSYELDIVMIPGNHDHNTSITMATLLEQMYSDCNDMVRVNKAIGTKSYVESLSGTRAYYLRGKVLLQIHHGDIDVKRVTNVIKHECKSFYVNANKIFSDYGHLHHKKIKTDSYIGFNKGEVVEYDGVVFRQRGSISISDGYHDRNAYIGGDNYLTGEIIDDKKGIVDILYSE